MISEKLKSIIFDKLYQDLKHCEIISYDKSVYFIDRDNKYWYFEYEKGGTLWWRYTFFNVFFQLFSITYKEFQPVLGEWVEEVLNCKVLTTFRRFQQNRYVVEEVLNCKVLTTIKTWHNHSIMVEEVLNHKVLNYLDFDGTRPYKMEETLNCKVLTTKGTPYLEKHLEDVLNYNESKT